MSKAIDDVISEKVAKTMLAGVNVDAIIATKMPSLEKVVGQMVDESIKLLKDNYLENFHDYLYDNGKIVEMLDKVVEQAVATRLGIAPKKTKKSSKKRRK